MNTTKRTVSKEKKLKHVKIYDRLYSMIKDGTFPAGSQLPSEPNLAVQMDVSRMTLRKALSLLQEDGLIQNIQGKGNFVKDNTALPSSYTSESIQHPITTCCTIEYNHIESEFRIEPPSDYMKSQLRQNTAAVVISDRWYKHDDIAFGYTLSLIPIETISKYKIDLSNNDDLQTFLEKELYEIGSESETSYSYTTTGNFTSEKYALSNHSKFILITETLYDKDNFLLLFNKHYIPLESFKLKIRRTAK